MTKLWVDSRVRVVGAYLRRGQVDYHLVGFAMPQCHFRDSLPWSAIVVRQQVFDCRSDQSIPGSG